MDDDKKVILFYDGECGLCHFAVRWVAKRDRDDRFLFASLQGETAKKLLPRDLPDTLVLYEKGPPPEWTLFGKGVFRTASYLPLPWGLLGTLSYLPSFIVDPLYRLMARHRNGLFTPPTSPTPPSIPPSKFLP